MDVLGLFWLPDIIVWIVVVTVGLYIYGIWPYTTLSTYGYKGPKPKPFIGNADLMYQTGFFGEWDLVGKRKFGKIFSMYEGRLPMLVVFDTDILKQVLVKEFSSFGNRRRFPFRGDVIQHSILDVNGDDWRRIRNLSTPFFTSGKLRKNIEVLQSCCQNLTIQCEQYATSKQSLDIKDLAGAYTLEAICQTALGLKINAKENADNELISVCFKMFEAFDNSFTPSMLFMFAFPAVITLLEKFGVDMWPKGCIATLEALTKTAVDERKKSHHERPDYIHALMKAHEEDIKQHSANGTTNGHSKKGLSDVEMVAQVAVFVLAGYDTTATNLSFLLFLLASNKDCQDKVVQEINDVIGDDEISYDNLKKMQYLEMCIDETLRLYPPILRTERLCIKDTTINGYFIPKDTVISIPIYSLHHDPELWNDPEKFDPERFSPTNRSNIDPYSYLPFGMGPRNCVGMRLAQIEIKMATINILKEYKLTVSEKTQMPLKMTPTFFTRIEGGLHLNIQRRQI